MPENVFLFQKRRDFGSVIGDSFAFLVKHFKSFLIGFLLYVGPFFLIGAIVQTMLASSLGAMAWEEGMFTMQFGLGIGFFTMMALISSIMLLVMVFAAVQKFREKPEERLIDGLWGYMKKYLGKILTVSLALLLVYVVIGAVVVGSTVLVGPLFVVVVFLLLVPFIIWISVPLIMVPYIYINEELGLMNAVRRSFYLIRDNWWSTFAVFVVLYLLASVISSVFVIPVYVVYFIQMLGSGMDLEAGINHGLWLGLIYSFALLGSLFVGIYQYLGIILQYYNLREKKEGTGLMKRIDEIGSDDLV